MQVVAVCCPLVSMPPQLSPGPVSSAVYCASVSLLDKCRAQQTVTASTAEDGCPDSQLPHHMSQFVKDNKFKKNQAFKTQPSAYGLACAFRFSVKYYCEMERFTSALY